MTREEIKQAIRKKEELKEQAWMAYQQLVGQIALLRDMLKTEEKIKPEAPKK